MTVRVKRTFEFDAPVEDVWEFIADPAKRAGAISVVERFDVAADGRRATWYLELPIPLIRSTAKVETEDVAVDEPTHVKFVGRSRVMRVTGEHTIEPAGDGCRLVNEFVVDGRLPGVETFFERNLDRELDNLEAALRRELEPTA
ncbi:MULTISPECIES: SRPBCC family protein [Haloferax]|uniref:Polyketide cyclase n=1 Tax=Haloferax marinum TaxID=2666143 RepID=A0A6A8G3S3_9EURY|nr:MULTISPECIES: SRPBCC family protein [Haloferax]KAB1196586.1 polyketide cyclase [Haloferax sp. CBA1150]MRW95589.1 polyketide cyclase [Haloferax marinum]